LKAATARNPLGNQGGYIDMGGAAAPVAPAPNVPRGTPGQALMTPEQAAHVEQLRVDLQANNKATEEALDLTPMEQHIKKSQNTIDFLKNSGYVYDEEKKAYVFNPDPAAVEQHWADAGSYGRASTQDADKLHESIQSERPSTTIPRENTEVSPAPSADGQAGENVESVKPGNPPPVEPPAPVAETARTRSTAASSEDWHEDPEVNHAQLAYSLKRELETAIKRQPDGKQQWKLVSGQITRDKNGQLLQQSPHTQSVLQAVVDNYNTTEGLDIVKNALGRESLFEHPDDVVNFISDAPSAKELRELRKPKVEESGDEQQDYEESQAEKAAEEKSHEEQAAIEEARSPMQRVVDGLRGDQAGSVSIGKAAKDVIGPGSTLGLLARTSGGATVGAGVGSTQGKTPAERKRNAVIGAIAGGLGGLVPEAAVLARRGAKGGLADVVKGMKGDGGQIDAFHGSPHKFDKFDNTHIGSGEGNQSFGHGFYFSNEKDIADSYASDLGRIDPSEAKYSGKSVQKMYDDAMQKMHDNPRDHAANAAAGFWENVNVGLRPETAMSQLKEGKHPGYGDFSKTIDMKKFEGLPEKNLYSVTIHKGKTPDQYDYLQWDGTVSDKQLSKISSEMMKKPFEERQRIYSDMGLDDYYGQNRKPTISDFRRWFKEELDSGDNVYGTLSSLLGGDKAASDFLLKAGVDGIEYPAGSLSDIESKARNYVVFDPNTVTIEKVNDKPISRIVRKVYGLSPEAAALAMRGEKGVGKRGIADVVKGMKGEGGAVDVGGKQTAEPLYSNAQKAVNEINMPKAPADQWAAMLDPAKGKGTKADEMKWIGLDDFLKEKGSETVTKQEIQGFIEQNKVQLEEVTKDAGQHEGYVFKDDGWGDYWANEAHSKDEWRRLLEEDDNFKQSYDDYKEQIDEENSFKEETGEPLDEAMPFEDFLKQTLDEDLKSAGGYDNTKFSSYQLPGGSNYRELLMTLPEEKMSIPNGAEFHSRSFPDGTTQWSVIKNDVTLGVGDTKEEALQSVRRSAHTTDSDKQQYNSPHYKSPHWDEPNVLAHVRLNDRTDAEGKKVLFIEEIQSDWHQEGRKKGYQQELTKEEKNRHKESIKKSDALKEKQMSLPYGSPEHEGILRQLLDINREDMPLISKMVDGVSQAPFSKTWHELAFKRILREAAEKGYDKVAWTTGEQQAARYDLSKQVGQVVYDSKSNKLIARGLQNETLFDDVVQPNEIENYIGKDAAKKLLESEQIPAGGQGNKVHMIEGDDLKVGGNGMKGFYDKILVDYANKYGKKWGAKVEDASLEKPEMTIAGPFYPKAGTKEKYTVHSMTITPAMRKSVMEEGQPMFSVAAGAGAAGTLAASQQDKGKDNKKSGIADVVSLMKKSQ
jgi:hypothetical protein